MKWQSLGSRSFFSFSITMIVYAWWQDYLSCSPDSSRGDALPHLIGHNHGIYGSMYGVVGLLFVPQVTCVGVLMVPDICCSKRYIHLLLHVFTLFEQKIVTSPPNIYLVVALSGLSDPSYMLRHIGFVPDKSKTCIYHIPASLHLSILHPPGTGDQIWKSLCTQLQWSYDIFRWNRSCLLYYYMHKNL